MKKPSRLTVFDGRLYFIILVCAGWAHANAVVVGKFTSASSALPVDAPVAATLPPPIDPIHTPLELENLESIKALVLDMDGITTPNSGALWKDLGQQFLRDVAPAWKDGDLREIKWKSLPDVHRWLTDSRGAHLGYEEYVQRREALAARIYGEFAKLEPTLLETLETLKAADVQVALASANTTYSVDSMIRKFRLKRAFDATASSDELAPDERALGKSRTHLLACRRLGVPPSRALAIEDTEAGVEAAMKAGLITVGLRNGFNDDENFSSAHFVIREIKEVLTLFNATPGHDLKK